MKIVSVPGFLFLKAPKIFLGTCLGLGSLKSVQTNSLVTETVQRVCSMCRGKNK